MAEPVWHDVGSVDELRDTPLRQIQVGRTTLALSSAGEEFAAVSGVCNHAGGPLGEGRLDGDYIVCPWHQWKFHRRTGEGEPGFEDDRVPRHEVRVANGRVLVNLTPSSKRNVKPHAPHPLARKVERAPGPIRVAGISTTAMDAAHPRYSTSDALLETAISHAGGPLGAETQIIRLNELRFRPCAGYYSKSAHACTWPCSITQMDPDDQLDRVYEAMIHWADVMLVSTPIRWGAPSGLYFKMAERLNCVQNQITLRNRVLMRNKVSAFIVTGGQDNVQAVAGQMLMFFAELGCVFPQFPFIGHSRGWTAEDMENNVALVRESEELRAGARALVERAVSMAETLLARELSHERIARGGRKASGERGVATSAGKP